MKTLQVTAIDEFGTQFNGHFLHKQLNKLGHESHMAVALSRLNELTVHEVGRGQLLKRLNPRLAGLEQRLGLQSILPVSALSLYKAPYYRQADIVHLHLPHMVPFFSLFNLPFVSRRKAVVWTIHDPWLLAGHCIYQMDCSKWLSGCGQCPSLERPIKVQRDATALNWFLKRWVMRNSRVHLIAASKWTRDRLNQSPITRHFPCTTIPFGIDNNVYRPRERAYCRRELGLPAHAKVLMFRVPELGSKGFKGIEYIEQALAEHKPREPTYLLTLDTKGGLSSLRNKFTFVELGWVKDPELAAKAYCAADIFLMPSTAEAFGLMSLESMACGTPVIVFEDTSLPDVIHAPKGGLAVPYGDAISLAQAIDRVLYEPGLKESLSAKGPEIVGKYYTLDLYVQRHLDLYYHLLKKQNHH